MKTQLRLSPARALTTTQGLIYSMSPQVWQLLPCCDKDSEEPTSEEGAFAPIDQLQLVTNWIQVIEQLRRKRRRTTRAYVRARGQRAHAKAQRCLRWKLNRAYRLLAEAMEVQG